MKKKFSISAVFILQLLFFSCANQIPPSGGADDKIPPKIIYVFPEPGRLNFKGDAVTFRFDEYVDRRSFEESFYISPKPKGEINFEWSGKEVEVRFEGKFANDRTYVITVGKELKDVRGSNSTGSSYSIAFSTGGKLDKGKISGRVYADKYDRIKILAYIRNVKTGTEINPAIQTADYITQTDDNGYYIFTNLPTEEFELFAVTDEDRNNLFSKDFESISILKSSIKIQDDSALYSDANFLFRNPVMNRSGID
ncbi:MAG: Ig-like domain-containing protein, partial [Ignavibacteria bacterium]